MEEPKQHKSVLQKAIDSAVALELEPIRAELKEIRKLLEDVGASVTEKDVDRRMEEKLENGIPELVIRAVTQMLATGAGADRPKRAYRKRGAAAAAGEDKPKCPRSPHKGPHGKKCREAGYQD